MNLIGEKTMACEVTKYRKRPNDFSLDDKAIAVEECFELRLNGTPFCELFCSPENLDDLAFGVLAQANKIHAADDVTDLKITGALIEVETKTACPPAPLEQPVAVRFVAKDLLNCADRLLGEMSTAHAKTNGTHSGALFDGERLLLFRKDVGRHNVFDKIFGAALRCNIFLGDKCLIFSGRCSSEMMIKASRMNVPAVVAKSVPTTYAVTLAKKFGITLAGRLRADSFCIYTNRQRIVLS